MKRLSFFSIAFTISSLLFGQTSSEINNMRSDTLDILNYAVQLDFTSSTGNHLKASCKVSFKAKMNQIQGISLDLLKLTVDSVKSENTILTYTYNDTLLRIHFANEINAGEISEVEIFYQGPPTTDPTGFGGFYFKNGYAYNLGVAFSDNPHNYGRVWHPCFDNFVERATYQVKTITPQGITSYGNGYIFKDSIGANNENIRTWKIDEEIPTYLACIGIADYAEVNETYTSTLNNNEIPIILAAKPADTTNMKKSFLHLPDAMEIFENNFGPYRWNKIGYTVVPFGGGAMEHATCIMYPQFAINGNLQWETLMAHELAHHWWGNSVTCRTAEDMWISEGLASFSEALFLEHLYGYDKYIEKLKNAHRDVIQRAHRQDKGFLPISGVPHDATYGSHTYNKGAVQMHNLRTYLGDNDFFEGLKAIQEDYAFKDVDVYDFRDKLNQTTGKNTTTFFDNYILNPGFNGFEIDSFVVSSQNSTYKVDVYIQQKIFEAPELFGEIPLQISFIDADWNSISTVEKVSGEHYSFSINLPFSPKMVVLNRDNGLLNAVTGEEYVINKKTYASSNYSYFYYNIQNEEDSSLLRIDHYRMAPDPIKNEIVAEHFVISPDRYWKVDGIWSESFSTKARFAFDARNTDAGNLDIGLFTNHKGITFTEDSLVLLYRPNQAEEWREYAHYEVNIQGLATDGYGRMDVSLLKKGEYAFGFRIKAGLTHLQKEEQLKRIKAYPNPTKDMINIDLGNDFSNKKIRIIDSTGKEIEKLFIDKKETALSTKKMSKGVYYILLYEQNNLVGKTTFIKE